MKSAMILAALGGLTAVPLAAQNVTPLPPQGQPTQAPTTSQPSQTTTPPLPGQAAPRPLPAAPASQANVPVPVQRQPQPLPDLPYEATGSLPAAQPTYQAPAQSYAPAPVAAAPSYKPSDFTTVADLAVQSAAHTRLVELLKLDGLVDPLKEIGPFTVFAPTNAAFDAMEPGALAALLQPENRASLDRLLKYHVVRGYLASSELVKQLKQNGGRGSLPTLSGQTLVATLTPTGDITLTDPQGHVGTITSADQPAFNGLLHVTNVVMVPATPVDPNARVKKKKKGR